MRAILILLLCATPLAAQTGLTIYSDGRVLVRRTVPTAVPSGLSNHRLALGVLLPETVFALDSGLVVTGARYDQSVDEGYALQRAVGRTLRLVVNNFTTSDTISATVIGVNPERYRLADGQIVFQRPGIALYPPDLVLTEPTLELAIRSARPRPNLRLGYFTQGASWRADYSVLLGASTARVTGQAAIPSSVLRETDAEVQLLAGSVGQARPFADKAMRLEEVRVAAPAPMAPAVEEMVGEAHLYTLPGRVTLEPGVTTNVALFDPATAPWERSYVVRGQLNYNGPLQQFGTEPGQVPVNVWYTLRRAAHTPFGDLPMPGGVWRLYQADAAGRVQLVGEARAGHTAPGTDVRLAAGDAFDLTGTRTQMTYTTRRDSIRTIGMADYRVSIASAKDSAVTVEVWEERSGEWSVVQSSIPAEKLSSTRTRFRVRVPARGEAVLTYRIRAVW